MAGESKIGADQPQLLEGAGADANTTVNAGVIVGGVEYS